MSVQDSYDVIVIGGGFAGLTAARDLRRAGRSVLVLEARDRLGGRTWYRPFAHTETKVELGGTWVAERWQPHVAAEIARYALPVSQSPAGVSFRSAVAGQLLSGSAPVPLEEAMDFERGLFEVIAGARRIDFGAPLDRQPLADLDVPFADFLDALGLARSTREYLSAWAGFFFGCHPSEVSGLHVLSWVAGFDCSAWAWYAAITDKLGHGTLSLVEALVADGDAEIRLSSPVARIDQDGEAVRVTTRDGEQAAAPAAILATPLNTWHDVEFEPSLSEPKREAAAEGQTGHSVKVWALADGVPGNLVGVGWGGGLNWLSEEFALPEGRLLVGFGTSPELLDVSSRDEIERAIRQFAPDARVLAADAHDWNADEFSQGTWMAFRPGQVMRFHSAFQEPEGRLAFAGSDLALGWAGWIDGAIETGARAARQALEVSAAAALR
jgi:monoamine oxidase